MQPDVASLAPGGVTVAPPAVEADWKATVRTVDGCVPAGSRLLPFDGRDPWAAEQYRIVRAKIVHDPRRPRVIAISSPQLGDGKTLSAINIAAVLGLKNDADVALVDADCRRPAASALLDAPPYPGLQQVLSGECQVGDAVVRLASTPNLWLLPVGQKRRNPAELFEGSLWRELVTELRRVFSFVIIDTPPVGSVADSQLIHAVVDGVILVIRPDHTTRTRCKTALQVIPQEQLLGVLPNCVSDWFMTKSLYHDYSYYSKQP